jgi:hypothetical protein
VGSGDKSDESSDATTEKLPSANLDDFSYSDNKQLTMQLKAKNLDVHGEGTLYNPFFPPQTLQDKSDSVVVPSFLYQQPSPSPALDNSYANNSQSRTMDQGFGLQHNAGAVFSQNNQRPLIDMLGHQGSASVFNQSHQADVQPNTANSFDQRMSNFISMSNRQSLLDETSNQLGNNSVFGNSSAPNPTSTIRSGQRSSLEQNLFQLGGGSDAQLGLSSFSGNTQTADTGQLISGDGLWGSRVSNTMSFLPSLSMGGASGRGVLPNMVQNPTNLGGNNCGDDNSFPNQQHF